VIETEANETTIANVLAGQVVTRPNKKYVAINRRIANLQENFDMGEIGPEDFIRGVAHNLANPLAF